MSVRDFVVKGADGRLLPLSTLPAGPLLIVNTASQCGFTPQYAGLQKLYDDYRARGLTVIGFPCNQFGAQEPGDDREIANFCSLNYEVTFPVVAKVMVNGARADELFHYLKMQKKGLFGSEAIKWNFTKFLVDRAGRVVKRYAPTVKPEALRKDIERVL